ncbi:anti-sigma-factor antagonist [Rhizorhabdus wittichii RW1]|uniref:Anti-sigma factor antagonist n=2 Tax=Rhizorhabdus wittichii TaxID=160791 RepID=A0A9J9HAA1_RHIWR|nr:anti-sigma-factor antagonist [Rhizorhabdus wittichii RW1]
MVNRDPLLICSDADEPEPERILDQMDISENSRDGTLVISAAGRIDSTTAGELEAVLPARVRDHGAVVVDLSGVPYVSSAGLRVLLIGAKGAKAAGHRLVITGVAPAVREVFDISGFSKIFAIEADVDAAIASLG